MASYIKGPPCPPFVGILLDEQMLPMLTN